MNMVQCIETLEYETLNFAFFVFFFERPAGPFLHSLLVRRAIHTTMSNNNNTIEETERLLHPETRALLSSINNNAPLYQKYPRERTTTSSVQTFLTTRNVLGGIGVATVALGSYVSGYRSSMLGNTTTTTTTMRLGNEQQSKKVVLHTGCSPVAQVCETTRWLFFVSHLSPIPRPLSRLDDDDDDDDYLCFVQTTRSSFRKRWKKNNFTLLLLLLRLLLDVTTNN